ncbi:MAG: IPT/TIG domain-containing protein [Chloroflexi bacterium]|nr:IPT/TIG domain-containing protein [Chloroflexota bacterium]
MTASLPNLTLASLPAPTPAGSIQFFDGYFPALEAGTYTIGVAHTLAGTPGTPPSYTMPTQTFIVQAPEFSIDTTIVQSFYPPAGGSDVYGQQLPFIVLTDPALPWERSLIPGQGQPSATEPTPWMALLIFAAGEIELPANSNNPVTAMPVSQLLAADPNVLKPQLPSGWVAADVLASQTQTITITGAAFKAVVPSPADLRYMVHCRGVNTLDEGELLLSVLLSNRLAVTNATITPAAPLRYYAHLVSLEGFADYMGPDGKAIPTKPNSSDPMDVQLVSFFNWTFTSQPESDLGFEEIIKGLIGSEQSESTTPSAQGALALPMPPNSNLPQPVQNRLVEGYVALRFVSGSGDDSFAWYRGPFSAAVPQALPTVGNPPVPIAQAQNADELMIYLADQGLFDLSYAAAWNIGRGLALADPNFAQNVSAYRQAASSAVNLLAQRAARPHLADVADPQTLLARDVARRGFTRQIGAGLGRQWTAALDSARQGSVAATRSRQRTGRARRQSTLHPRSMLADPAVSQAVSTNLGAAIESVAAWLANLSLLYPLPFSYLVPDPRMLPVESIRFFYVDQDWIEALNAGALSIAIHNSADVALQAAMLPQVHSAVARQRQALFSRSSPAAMPDASDSPVGMTGMLIRSQLVSGWPQLVISATLGGAPVNIVRNDCPAANVRLCIFEGIPDTVTLAEPYQGLLFGVEDLGIYPRCVTSAALTGALLANEDPIKPTLRTPASGYAGGVLDVQATATALESAVGVKPFVAGAVVQWNGTPLSTTFVSAEQLTAIVPASLTASPGKAVVTVVSGGATSLPVNFIVDAPLEIDAINPTLVQVGENDFTLTVAGTGFATNAVVQWNGAPLTTTVISLAEATAVVPAAQVAVLGTATITILSNSATSNGMTLSIVGGDPVINTLRPNVVMAGGEGFALTINGSGFTADAVVQWNGSALPTTYVNDQQLTARVTASLIANAGSASVTVIVGGTTSNSVSFTIAGAQPTIGLLQPSVALAGGNQLRLVIDGVNFAANAQVLWNGSALATTFDDAEQLTAIVPASLLTAAATASVTVSSGGVTSNAVEFTVLAPQPAIGLLEPASVVAGGPQFTLTITGGFGAGDFALQMVAAPEQQSFITA